MVKDLLARYFGIFVARYRKDYKYVLAEDAAHKKITPKPGSFIPDGKSKCERIFDEELFLALADKVLEDGRTYLNYDRLFVLWQAIRNSYRLGLVNAEVGSFRGGSACFIAGAAKALAGKELPLHIFDTFEGHDASTISEGGIDANHVAGKFSGTDFLEVTQYLKRFEKLEAHKGEFSKVAKSFPEFKYGFVHIDVDIYRSTLDCLMYFTPRLAQGGVIVVDDFNAPSCPGVNLALKEFLSTETGSRFLVFHPMTEQLLMVKK